MKNNLYLLKIIWKLCPLRLIGEIVMRLLDYFEGIFLSVIFLEVIFNALESGGSFQSIVNFIIFSALFLTAIQLYTIFYKRIIFHKGNQILYGKLNLLIFEKVNDVELACYENTDFYQKYTKAASQAKSNALKLIDTTARAIAHFISCFYLFYKLWILDASALWMTVIPVFLTYALQKRINYLRYQHDMDNIFYQRKKEYVNRVIYQSDYAKELRLTNIKNVLLSQFDSAVKGLMLNLKTYGARTAAIVFVQGLLSGIMLNALYNIYALMRLFVFRSVSLGSYVALVSAMMQLYAHLSQLNGLFARFRAYDRYTKNLRGLLEYKPTIAQSQKGAAPNVNGNILTIKNLSFSYQTQGRQVLKNINMEIKPKQKICIVGKNGSGKSTLVKLIMRLYDATEGEILLNDKDIKEYQVQKYRDLFATIFQDFKLFAFSIADNIVMGKSQINQEALVWDSLKVSGMYDKVVSLKNGIDANLTKEFDEDGVILSGGELQKIAIARAYAKNSEFLILDEPSSAIDPIMEAEIFDRLFHACQEKTVIFISHRMSSALLADKIYVMDEGQIVESGTHENLMKNNGLYAKMFHEQAKYYC